MVLEAIRYSRSPSLHILDQLQLPHKTEYISIRSTDDAWHAIREMRVRGAPAIAIVAVLSLAVELQIQDPPLSNVASDLAQFIEKKLDYLVSSRPTAVNLADAAAKLRERVEQAASVHEAKPEDVVKAYVDFAERMMADDVKDNENIGRYGAEWIMKTERGQQGKVGVLTHCNTGSLATAGYGTALGVVRSLHAHQALRRAFFTETRPYNQGTRLTAYELIHDGIPGMLIPDSAAAALLARPPQVDNMAAVVVGADRVCANGDTANKIGTYSLAILARHHGIPFLVAAPRTTIDLRTASGKDVVIEERAAKEVTLIRGPLCTEDGSIHKEERGNAATVRVAVEGVEVWNPAFDVTPAELIGGIITEVGVATKKEDGKYRLAELFEQ